MDPRPVAEILERLLERCGLREKRRLFELFTSWEKILGPSLAAHSQPLRLRDGVIEVRVDQAVWMQHLHLQKSKIIEAVNGHLRERLVRDIFWRFGTLEKEEKSADLKTPVPVPPPVQPLEADTETLLQALQDGDLRERFRRLILDSKER